MNMLFKFLLLLIVSSSQASYSHPMLIFNNNSNNADAAKKPASKPSSLPSQKPQPVIQKPKPVVQKSSRTKAPKRSSRPTKIVEQPLPDSNSYVSVSQEVYDKVYFEAKPSELVADESQNSKLELSTFMGFGMPQSLFLENRYFTVQYAKQVDSLPLISFSAASEIYQTDAFELMLLGSAGYTQTSGVYKAKSYTGIEIQDTLSVKWIPMLAAATIAPSSDWRLFKPSFYLGFGANWMHQSGTVDGIDQSYLIPMLATGIGCRIIKFDNPGKLIDGLDVGLDYYSDVASHHDLKVFQFKVGTSFSL
jgi:hypothetical protein